MRRRPGIWIVGLLAAALVAAAVGAHASPAASIRAASGAATIDSTYSCRVRSARLVDLYASVTQPPVNNKPQPGLLVLTTGVKTVVHNNTTVTVSQMGVQAVKNGLKIDKSSCRREKRQIPLKPKGLPTPATTLTAAVRPYDSERCGTSARVLFRLRLKTTNGIPSHALLAIRNDNKRAKPIAFYNWSPKKVTAFTGNGCAAP